MLKKDCRMSEELQILKYFEEGRYRDALKVFESIRPDLDNPFILFELGVAYKREGEQSKARELFRKAIGAGFERPDAHRELGEMFMADGEYESAIREFTEGLKIGQNDSLILHQLGLAHQRRAEYEQSAGYIEKAIESGMHEINAYRDLGYAYFKQKKYAQAKKAWEEGIRIKPDDVHTLHYLGLLFKETGNMEKACACLEKAVRGGLGRSDAYWELGEIYRKTGEPGRAIQEFEEGLKIKPDDSRILFHLALIYKETGDRANARKYLNETIRCGAEHPDAHRELGEMFMADGEYESAIREFTEGLKIGQNDSLILHQLGLAHQRRAEYEQSAGYIEKAIESGMHEINAYRDLGYAYFKQKKYAQAKKAWEEGIRIKPDDIYTLRYLGLLLKETGDIGNAIAWLKDLPLPDVHLDLGRTYLLKNQYDLAVHEFEMYGSFAEKNSSVHKTRDAAERAEIINDSSALVGRFERTDVNTGGVFAKNIELKKSEVYRKIVCDSKPVSLTVSLSTECNLECIMCTRVREARTTLPYDVVSKIWPLLPYLRKIAWIGGEVFIIGYFKELLQRISDEYGHIEHGIITNGLKIDRDCAGVLAQCNANLTFSIDSVIKKNYEAIRRGGRFETLLENLETVSEAYRSRYPGAYYNSTLNVVVMKRNMDELELFPEFCSTYRIRRLQFSYLRPDVVPHEDIFNAPNHELTERLRDTITKVKKKCEHLGVAFNCTFGHLLPFHGENAAGHAAMESKNSKRVFKCVYPWTNIFLHSDGLIMPQCCCNVPVGNIYHNTIEEIWNGKIMQMYRRKLIDNTHEGFCASEDFEGLLGIE
jgi:tetratricopeptide (TPR) repeat protein/MoaA/NifB/PqqE/SkfB family radical SAM enzyme